MTVERSGVLADLSDEELLARYYAGDNEAFAEFDARHRSILVRQAGRRLATFRGERLELADDLACDTLMHVVRTKSRPESQWNPSRGPVAPWLATILRNRVISFLRSARRREILASDLPLSSKNEQCQNTLDSFPATNNLAGPTLDNIELRHRLRLAMERLPRQQQRICELKYWGNYSHKEIGDRLGVSPATVSRWLAKAQEMLCGALSRHALSA